MASYTALLAVNNNFLLNGIFDINHLRFLLYFSFFAAFDLTTILGDTHHERAAIEQTCGSGVTATHTRIRYDTIECVVFCFRLLVRAFYASFLLDTPYIKERGDGELA